MARPDTDETKDTTSSKSEPGEKGFVKEAVQGNLAEIALAEVATQKAQNPEVKQFAEQIRKDHTEANQKLQAIAQKNGASTTELDPKHQKKITAMEKMSGDEFDKAYAKDMLKDHAKDVAKYERASREFQDPELKQYVTETLPKLREHLEHAQTTAKAVGIDESTISSLMKQTPESVGGVSETESSERGAGKKHVQPKDADSGKP